MKIKWNEALTRRTVSGIVIVAAGILLYFGLQNIGLAGAAVGTVLAVLSPFMWGFAFAFLVNLPMNFIEHRLGPKLAKKAPRPKLTRILSLTLALLIALVLIALLFLMLIPQFYDSAYSFVTNLPTLFKDLNNSILSLFDRYNIDASLVNDMMPSTEKLVTLITDTVKNSVPDMLSATTQVVGGIVNVFIGVIICIYFLMSKEIFFAQAKKVLYAILPKRAADKTVEITRLSNRTFTGFIAGKIIESIIVGIICFIALWVCRMPYAMMISVIVCVTNVVPFFGPIAGTILAGLIMLMADPGLVIPLVIILIVLQQFDGNVLGPRILGDSTGLPAIWVMFAIFLGGGLFGVLGMLLAVPVFAVLYTLFKQIVEKLLKKKNMPPSTMAYRDGAPQDDAQAPRHAKAPWWRDIVNKFRHGDAEAEKSAQNGSGEKSGENTEKTDGDTEKPNGNKEKSGGDTEKSGGNGEKSAQTGSAETETSSPQGGADKGKESGAIHENDKKEAN